MKKASFVVSIIVSLGSGNILLSAQQSGTSKPVDTSDAALMMDLMELLNTPIESASKRSQKSIESPQAITLLTESQIRASGAFRLIDALKLMTGVNVYEFGRERAYLTIRGTVVNALMKNVQVLVDGVPLFNTENQVIPVDLIPVPIESVQQIEVVRGPSSSLYGANAQVGVVSITTKKAKTGVGGSVRAGAAEKGIYNLQSFFNYGSKAFNLTAGFSGNSRRDSGISDRVLGGTRMVDQEDQGHGSQVFLRPELVLGEGRLWAMYSKANNVNGPQVVESSQGTKVYQFRNSESSTEIAQLGWSQPWSSSFHTELKLNFNHLIPVNFAAFEVVPGSPTSAATVPILNQLDPATRADYKIIDSTYQQAVLQANWDPSETLHFVFGMDSAKMKAEKSPLLGLHAEQKNSATGGFLSVDWTLGPATFSFGGRIENETLGGSRTSPRMAVVYSLSESSVIRGGYFTSTRSPQVNEVIQDVRIPGRPAPLGNPNLKPEEFDNIEIGYRKNWSTWSLDLTAYQMSLKKVIGAQPTGLIVGGFAQTQYMNGKNSLKNKGLELTLQGELREGWMLGFNACAINFKDETGNQAFYSPKTLFNLWSAYHFQKFQAYVGMQRSAAYRRVNFSTITGPIEEAPSRFQVNFNVGYEVLPKLLVSVYGVNAARPSDETTAGSTNNGHLVRFSHREWGAQASYRF